MPIIVKINPVRVEEVEIQTDSEVWENVLLSTWPIVRKHLKKLNRDLRKNTLRIIEGTKEETNATTKV